MQISILSVLPYLFHLILIQFFSTSKSAIQNLLFSFQTPKNALLYPPIFNKKRPASSSFWGEANGCNLGNPDPLR